MDSEIDLKRPFCDISKIHVPFHWICREIWLSLGQNCIQWEQSIITRIHQIYIQIMKWSTKHKSNHMHINYSILSAKRQKWSSYLNLIHCQCCRSQQSTTACISLLYLLMWQSIHLPDNTSIATKHSNILIVEYRKPKIDTERFSFRMFRVRLNKLRICWDWA